MELLEATLILAIYAFVLAVIGRRFGIIDPIVLVLGGLGLSFLPFAPELEFEPHLVLTIFLPPVLYQAALHLSWRELKENMPKILMLAVGLVLVTAVAVAGISSILIAGFPFAAAMVLGAIVSPPDAVAATAVLSKVRVPRRLVTILEGESLINDATALVLYSFAVAAAMSGFFNPVEALGSFVYKAVGGIGLGWIIARLSVATHARLDDSLLEVMLSLTIPFITFIAAEHLHLSGVLAVVTAGIVRSSNSSRVLSAATRMQIFSMWNVIVFVLNAVGFLLIGLQMPKIVSNLFESHRSVFELSVYAFAVCTTVILVRLIWVYPAAWIIRQFSARIREQEPVPNPHHLAIIGWSGMRGILSLIAALALPTYGADYQAFPQRDMIMFLSYCVILVTLIGQGGTLGWLIRTLNVETESCAPQHGQSARLQLRQAGLEAILKEQGQKSATAVARARQHYEQMIAQLKRPEGEDALEALIESDGDDYFALATQAIKAERAALREMWKAHKIEDSLARELLEELDLHEILISSQRAVG